MFVGRENEAQEKIERFKSPKGYTVRPALIHSRVLASGIEEDAYFYHTFDLDKLLTARSKNESC